MELDTVLHELNVSLSKNQKLRIYKAFRDRDMTNVWLKKDYLTGSDTLLVPSYDLPSVFIHPYDKREIPMYTVVDNLEDVRKKKKGISIRLNYSLMHDSIKNEVAKNVKKLIA